MKNTVIKAVNKFIFFSSEHLYLRFKLNLCFGVFIMIFAHLPVSAQDFITISWGTAASQQYPVSEAQGRVVNGKLYSFGGFDSQKSTFTPTKRAYVYDPVANIWSAIADLPHIPNGIDYGGVTHAGIATDGTDIYIAGGYKSNSTGTGQIFGTKQVWKYIISQNAYTRLPDLPIYIASGQLEYLGGKLHYIGGSNLERTLDLGNHYVLDLNNLTGGWANLAPLPNPRNHAGSAVYGGKIYFIGGQHSQDANLVTQKDVHVYDPLTNIWTKVADLPVPEGANGRGHISSGVAVIGNRIIVLGGEIVHKTSINMVSAYSPATNSWENLTALPKNRYSGVAGVMNSIIYYTGGSTTSTTFKGIPDKQKIESFTLINADNGQPIQNITNGAIINLALIPGKRINILANTIPPTVGSVVFDLTGTEIKNVTDNFSPYTLFGDDNNGTFYPWTPSVGNYNLKAIPYNLSGGTGTPGTDLSVSFTITDQPSEVFPLNPIADSYVRNGTYSDKNYGNDTILIVKGSSNIGFSRYSYIKFDVRNITNITSAQLNIYGHNIDTSTNIILTAFGVNNDTWSENGITFNNQPTNITTALSTVSVNDQEKYWGFDVTNFVKSETNGDSIVSFVIKDILNKNKSLWFNSRENSKNHPQLIISRTISGIDTIPPAINVLFTGTLVSPDTYQNQVQISINSSDSGGSGLAYTQYSLNNGPYQNYTGPFSITTEGSYTIKAKAGDGNGNITETNQIPFTVTKQNTPITLLPVADASVRNGSYSDKNYGGDTTLLVKTASTAGYTRVSYLKFSLNNISSVSTAKLRVYGSNFVNSTGINLSCYGVDTDSWMENLITWNNAPSNQAAALCSSVVNDQLKYYEFDVTGYVESQLSGDKIVSIALKDTTNANQILSFSSRENTQNPPQLVIDNSTALSASNKNYDEFNYVVKPKIYPNPSGNRFNIDFPSTYFGNYKIQLTDILGRTYGILKTEVIPGKSTIEINVSKFKLAPGIYCLKIISAKNNIDVIRLILQ